MYLQFLAGFPHRNLEPVLLADMVHVRIEEWPIAEYALFRIHRVLSLESNKLQLSGQR